VVVGGVGTVPVVVEAADEGVVGAGVAACWVAVLPDGTVVTVEELCPEPGAPEPTPGDGPVDPVLEFVVVESVWVGGFCVPGLPSGRKRKANDVM